MGQSKPEKPDKVSISEGEKRRRNKTIEEEKQDEERSLRRGRERDELGEEEMLEDMVDSCADGKSGG